ncbi:MAG: hypothetical protein M1817_003170 [Caeruleum heppii]|nr:MAG: hypothetical protein M1817_003170 [Caeruleum heppii]
MSRRPVNPPPDRGEKNQQTIKTLLKLEGNKSCADCKRNKHPRWASWNLGVFVCIRCSGIHRGMGTHISRVKSVDLDAWTDEQLQSVLQWGNTRANKYWEAKLAQGHIPSEAKLENFIRTKYESKRWVMDGPMPDPATLDDQADEDICCDQMLMVMYLQPLSVVQEKQKLERSSSNRVPHPPSQAPQPARPSQPIDLFGDDTPPAPRPNTTDPLSARQTSSKAAVAPPKASKPGDSLLGLDFLGSSGGPASNPGRPASASSAAQRSAAPSRPDLKQSILSLYASAPRQSAPPQSSNAQSNISSPSIQPTQSQNQQTSSFGGLSDAFGGLSFGSATSPPPASPTQKPPAFAKLGSFNQKSTPTTAHVTSPGTGGGFFDVTPQPAQTSPPPQKSAASQLARSSSGFGDFQATSGGSGFSNPVAPPSSSGIDDLFDFSSPAPASQPAPPKQPDIMGSQSESSVFNLSTPATLPPPKPVTTSTPTPVASDWSNADAWGSNDAWGAADTNPSKAATVPAPKQDLRDSGNASTGWQGGGASGHDGFGSIGNGFASPTAPTKVSADEDFGGWNSAMPAPAATTNKPAPPAGSSGGNSSGLGGGEDLFSNVWE